MIKSPKYLVFEFWGKSSVLNYEQAVRKCRIITRHVELSVERFGYEINL
jgi:hypothetical protein